MSALKRELCLSQQSLVEVRQQQERQARQLAQLEQELAAGTRERAGEQAEYRAECEDNIQQAEDRATELQQKLKSAEAALQGWQQEASRLQEERY